MNGSEDASTPTYAIVRVWLPDRPGALGLVSARIGAVHGDIVGIEVLEHGGGIAVDEFAVVLPNAELVPLLVRELEQVDGTSVEEVRTVADFPDPRLDALETAAALCAATSVDELLVRLTEKVHAEFGGTWTALLLGDRLRHGAGPVPPTESLTALAAGVAASPVVTRGESGPEDLAVAAITGYNATLLVGRDGYPFRRRERAQLLALARIAAHVWELLGP